MPIEFQCQHCGKLLCTRDDAAGKQAKCPDCAAINVVPQGASYAASESSAPARPVMGREQRELTSNPYQSPGLTTTVATAAAYETGADPRTVDITDVWSLAWGQFKAKAGICVGVFLLPIIINSLLGFAFSSATPAILESLGRDAVPLFNVLCNTGTFLLSIYMGVGQRTIMLKLAKGRETRFGDLFPPPLLALKVVAGWLLLGLAFVITFITVVGPFIVALMFWPYAYIVIERDAGIGEALSEAYQMTRGNRLSVLGLTYLTWLLVMAATIFTCGLGAFAAFPFTMLVFPVTYLIITGRRSLIPSR